jgi:hypothetical protein
MIDNLILDHVRIGDYAAGAAICKESFFELQNIAMLAIEASNKSFQRKFEFSFASQPGAMDTVTSAIHIAIPDSLKCQQDIAVELRSYLFQAVGKPDWRPGLQAADASKRPLILRPFVCGNESRVLSSFGNSAGEPL